MSKLTFSKLAALGISLAGILFVFPQATSATETTVTVNWTEDLWPAYHHLTMEQAETVWRRLQGEVQFQKLPDEFKTLLKYNKANYSVDPEDVNTFVIGRGGGYFFPLKS